MNNKINVIFLVHSFSIGGVQKANISMINNIDKSKFNVHVLYVEEGMLKGKLNTKKIKVIKIGNKLKLKSFTNIKYIYYIVKYIKKNKIDLIHTIDPVFYIIGSTASRIENIGHIRTQPNFIRRHEKLNIKTLKLLPFEKWTDKYITYNKGSNKDLNLAGVDQNKIETIYGYSKLKDYNLTENEIDIYEEFNIPKNNKIILAMHRMVPKKGYESFIEMIPYIVNKYNKVTFLLVGDGPIKKKLGKKIIDLNIKKYVRFAGFRTEIIDIIDQIDFGVYPLGDTAAMGHVIKAGKVLISLKNSAMDEYIIHNKTGFLVPEHKPRQYAKYALKLLENKNLLCEFEKEQQNFIRKRFDGEENIRRLEEIFKRST